jgi:predicted acetyltransferase
MYVIKPLDESHVGAYQEIAYNAYPSFKDLSDDAIKQYNEMITDILINDPNVIFYGVFESNELIAAARFYKFRMNCFGKIVATGGLGSLGVHLLHKKKGAATALVKLFEDFCQKEQITLGMLFPFRPDYYKKFGYGFGTKFSQYRVKTECIPEYNGECDLRYVKRTDLTELFKCHDRFAAKNHGMICKIYNEINNHTDDFESKIVASYGKDGLMNGYIIFKFLNGKPGNYTINHINVAELIFESPDILHALLGFLHRQRDQVQVVIFNTSIDAFHFLFNNPLNDTNTYLPWGNLETNTQSTGIMYKLIGIADAFKQFGYRNYNNANLTARFTVMDEKGSDVIEDLTVSFVNGQATVLPVAEDSYDICATVSQSNFSSLFMGCVSVKELVYLNQLKVSNEAFIDKLDMAFYCNPKPMNNTDY